MQIGARHAHEGQMPACSRARLAVSTTAVGTSQFAAGANERKPSFAAGNVHINSNLRAKHQLPL